MALAASVLLHVLELLLLFWSQHIGNLLVGCLAAGLHLLAFLLCFLAFGFQLLSRRHILEVLVQDGCDLFLLLVRELEFLVHPLHAL